MKRTILAISLFFLIPIPGWSNISVTLNLDRNEAQIIDTIEMQIRVSGTRSSDYPVIEGLQNFIISKGGSSTHMEIINGNFSSRIEFDYILQPKKIGSFTIGPAKVIVNGKTYKSNIEKLTVKKSATLKQGKEQPLFLTATRSPKNAYIEDQVLYTLKLYHLYNISDVTITLPENENLTLKQLGKHKQYKTKLNSKNYSVIELRYSITPLKPGRYSIGPTIMKMSVYQKRSRTYKNFDDLFSMDSFMPFSRGRSTTLSSNIVQLKVKQLPDKGKPSNFGGLVGDFKIKSELHPSIISAGESTTLTIDLSGFGNINRIPDLKLPKITSIKIYADQPSLQIEPMKKGFMGIKTMKWAIVPEKGGEFKIPSLSICFFDTIKNKYRNIKTTSYTLIVNPGSNEKTEESIGNLKNNQALRNKKKLVEELGKDILPIHGSIKNLSSISFGSNIWLSWFFILFPAIVYFVFHEGLKFTTKTPKKIAQSRASKAARICIRKCQENEINANSLLNALKEYINNRFNINMGMLTPAETAKILSSQGCNEETIKQAKSILINLENNIYTGKGKDLCDYGEEVSMLVKKIEKEIR